MERLDADTLAKICAFIWDEEVVSLVHRYRRYAPWPELSRGTLTPAVRKTFHTFLDGRHFASAGKGCLAATKLYHRGSGNTVGTVGLALLRRNRSSSSR